MMLGLGGYFVLFCFFCHGIVRETIFLQLRGILFWFLGVFLVCFVFVLVVCAVDGAGKGRSNPALKGLFKNHTAMQFLHGAIIGVMHYGGKFSQLLS